MGTSVGSGDRPGGREIDRRVMVLALGVAVCLQVGACAPVVSTLRPAAVLPQGSVNAAMGYGVNVPVGALMSSLDRAKDLALDDSGSGMSDAEVVDLVGASLLLLTNAPLPSVDFQAAYGLWAQRVELDLRKSSGAWRFGARLQLLHTRDFGLDLSIGVGASTFSTPTVLDLLSKAGQAETNRYAIDVPILMGWTWEFGHLWFGPKVLYTSYSLDLALKTGRLPVDDVTGELPVEQAHMEGDSIYIGGQLGGAVGYKYAWITAELTVMQVAGSVDYRVGEGDNLLQGSLDPGGLVISPNIGILLQY